MNPPQRLVTFTVAGQTFGVPIARVQDAFMPEAITIVPTAPAQVAGLMNLRGRIVTAISLRDCLGLPPAKTDHPLVAIGIEHQGALYGLLVEVLGEVLAAEPADCEEIPANLDPKLQSVSGCIYRLKDKLLVVLDVDRLLDFRRLAA